MECRHGTMENLGITGAKDESSDLGGRKGNPNQ